MRSDSMIRFVSFPRTEPPPDFVEEIVRIFRTHERNVGTIHLEKGKTSDEVLKTLRNDLVSAGFDVESGKHRSGKIQRPVFFGEGGAPTLKYEIDAYHPEWRCGLEVEAGRAWMGNAVYRDLVQGLVMVQVDHLTLAVPNIYKYKSGGRLTTSRDYDNTFHLVETLYSHSRVKLPYGLTLIGY